MKSSSDRSDRSVALPGRENIYDYCGRDINTFCPECKKKRETKPYDIGCGRIFIVATITTLLGSP